MNLQKRFLTVFTVCLLAAAFAACSSAPSTNTAANVANRSVNAVSNGNAAPANHGGAH